MQRYLDKAPQCVCVQLLSRDTVPTPGSGCGACPGWHFQLAKGSASPAEPAQTSPVSGNDASVSCMTQVFSFSHRGRVVRERKTSNGSIPCALSILDEQHSQSPFCPRLLMCPGHCSFSTRTECGLLLVSRPAVTLSRETESSACTH